MDLHDQRTARMILIGLCAVALLAVYFGTQLLPFTYRARAAQIGELGERQAKLSLDLQRARHSVARLGQLEADLAAAETRWERAQRLLPEETQIAALLRDITERGQKAGVDFLLFKPMPPAPQQGFTERPVEIKVEGGYHQVARFLNQISLMDRIVHVRDLDIEQVPPNEEDEDEGPARARFVASAYVLGGSAPVAAEAASGEGSTSGRAVSTRVAGSETTRAQSQGPAASGGESQVRVQGRSSASQGGSEE